MIDLSEEILSTDVLVVGGGIAGLMAAIHAAEKGASVIVAEKANTKRSGCGATGNDHFCCYMPEVHGEDMAPIVKEYKNSQLAGFVDDCLVEKYLENSFERVKNWDRWGISMRPTGQWEFTGHAFPGRPRIWLKYAGHNQKKVLTGEAKKRGVTVKNHLPVIDIISDKGEILGAIGIDIRNERPVMKVLRAKGVVLTTGCGSRLYPSPTPSWMFNTANCPACTGSGQAMAFRAGAKLVNMEFPTRHAGPKYFARCGKASWIGLYRDPHGRPIGSFVDKPTKELGDITGDIWSAVFTEMHRSGRGPAYMDCSETSEENIRYMIWSLEHEGNTAMLEHMKREGLDFRKHMFEFMQYEPFMVGRGIEIDVNGESSLKGLYAAGDLLGNFRADIAGAATFGWIAGGSAAHRAKQISGVPAMSPQPLLEERRALYSNIQDRETGASWQEANLALQQIMNDYAGVGVRSETLLRAGLKYLRDLKAKALSTLRASNAHTLMRCLETVDLMECGEAIFVTALERKETRALHRRADFPFTNPLLQDKFLTVRKHQGDINMEWRNRH